MDLTEVHAEWLAALKAETREQRWERIALDNKIKHIKLTNVINQLEADKRLVILQEGEYTAEAIARYYGDTETSVSAATAQPEPRIPHDIKAQYESAIEAKGRNTPDGKHITAYLYAAQGMSNREIAALLDYKDTSITKHINAGREKAREIGLPTLEPYMPEHRKQK